MFLLFVCLVRFAYTQVYLKDYLAAATVACLDDDGVDGYISILSQWFDDPVKPEVGVAEWPSSLPTMGVVATQFSDLRVGLYDVYAPPKFWQNGSNWRGWQIELLERCIFQRIIDEYELSPSDLVWRYITLPPGVDFVGGLVTKMVNHYVYFYLDVIYSEEREEELIYPQNYGVTKRGCIEAPGYEPERMFPTKESMGEASVSYVVYTGSTEDFIRTTFPEVQAIRVVDNLKVLMEELFQNPQGHFYCADHQFLEYIIKNQSPFTSFTLVDNDILQAPLQEYGFVFAGTASVTLSLLLFLVAVVSLL